MEIVKGCIRNGKKVFVTSKGETVGQGRRTIKDGSKFNHLIKIEDVKNTSSLTYGNVNDTVHLMKGIIEKYHYQVDALAKYLRGKTELETCESIWNFVFHHIQYKRDRVDREQLSTPARLWLNRSKTGTPSDCDDHSLFIGALLYCLGIPFKIRIAGYDGKPFSHVYIVTKSNICIDTVLHAFNKEAQFTSKQDSKIMQIETLQGHEEDQDHELNGLGAVDALQKTADDYDNQTEDFVEVDDLDNMPPDALNGFLQNALNQEEDALKTLAKGQMKIALEQYEKEPELYHAKGFAPAYWVLFRQAYNALSKGESLDGIIVNMGKGAEWERQNLNPVNGLENEFGETVGFMGGLEGWFKSIRRKIKKVGRKIRKGVKKGFKSVGKGLKKFSKWAVKQLKKIGKFIMKINPIMIVVRAMLLKNIKANRKDLAIKLGYGLLTQKQAEQIGLSLEEWKKAKRAYAKFAKKYSFFGGRVSKLNSTLKKAWFKHTTAKGLKNVKLNGVIDLGQLEGRRSRRRRRRRRAKRKAAAAKAAAERRAYDLDRKLYEDDKRENAAAARKLKNRSKWEKERIAFLKQMFPKEGKGLKGLGVVATAATTGAATGVVAKVLQWLFKMLDKIGLGKMVEKLKKKHIAKIKEKLSKAPTAIAKEALEKKLKRAENNLVIFQKDRKENKARVDERNNSNPAPVLNTSEPSAIPTARPLTDGEIKPKTASMGKFGLVALLLIGGGTLWAANKKEKENQSKTKK